MLCNKSSVQVTETNEKLISAIHPKKGRACSMAKVKNRIITQIKQLDFWLDVNDLFLHSNP